MPTRNRTHVSSRTRRPHRAFALAELAALLAILTIVFVLLAVLLPDARRRSQAAGSLTNLQRLGAGVADYGQENADSIVSFTWRAGQTRSCDNYSFPVPADDLQAAANQAVCIMRRLGGRNDIQQISAWVPHLLYSLLPLMEYMDERLPSRLAVSPGDRLRLEWQTAAQRDPADPNNPFFSLACRPAGTSNGEKRWPFSSSYEMQPSFYTPDHGITINQASSHRTFNLPANVPYGQRLLSEVAFPSQKAMLYESNQRFFGSRELFFMYSEARIPVLFADGSASIRSISTANNGWNPSVPRSANPTGIPYQPELTWETPTISGATSEFVNGGIRWTQRGLLGRDFSGPEVAPLP